MTSPTGSVQTVPEGLAYWAAATPDAPALLAPEREPATYRDLGDAVVRLASELRALGVGREDGIALLLPDSPDLCLALLAAVAVGIAVPLAWPNPPAEYRRILASRRVRVVMVSAAIPRSGLDLGERGLPVITLASGATGRPGDFRVEGQPLGEPTPARLPQPDDVALNPSLLRHHRSSEAGAAAAPQQRGDLSRHHRGPRAHVRRSRLEPLPDGVQPGPDHPDDRPSFRGAV